MLKTLQKIDGLPAEILARIDQAAATDTAAEKEQKRSGIAGCSLLAAVPFSFFLTGPLAFRLDSRWPYLINLACGVAAVVFLVRAWRASRENVDNRKLDTVRRVVHMLGVDMTRQKRVSLELDFRSYAKLPPVSKESKWFSGQRRLSFVQPWLKLDASLADGSRLRLVVIDSVGRKERRKRKYTKIKERFTTKVSVAVRLPEGRDDPASIAREFSTHRPPVGLFLRGAAGRGNRLVVSFAGKPVVRTGRSTIGADSAIDGITAGDELLAAVSWVYNGLAPKKG